jgi:hypothetical protein
VNVFEKLLKVQSELKAPKNQYNSFGKYHYRSCEDIQEGVKPLLKEINAALVVGDELILVGDRYYIKATAKFIDAESGEFIINTSFAREEFDKKGMDSSQITGSASSYARKYALNGLFCIDDTKDADTMNNGSKEKIDEYKCEICGTPFVDFDWKGKHYTAKQGYEIAKKNNNGVALCNQCKKSQGGA